ncbi:DUF1367 family protein [Gayadomonas joobiniege]|uniref:DUF1367 family protein n=1 Tax=Gayadomonas joobiniege TaxID=1234606 RepID=UPI00192B2F30|nr:DUF1367 family protein [Gayadomonas joobiniege]
MMEGYFLRVPQGLVPENDETAEAIKKLKVGNVIKVEFKQPRNYEFHKRFFALLKIGFDHWEPPESLYKGLPVQKNFERFRKDVTISAGYYEPVANIRGEVRAEAKSISFARMTQDEFEKLYNAAANVLLQKVLINYTRPDLDRVVETLLRF